MKRYFNKHFFKTAGFTLIELLVVFSLISILLSISLAAFNSTRKSARDGKRKADLELLRAALEMYRTDVGTYPLNLPLLVSSKYTASIPTDPLTSSSYAYVPGTNKYTLCASLETGSGDLTSVCGTCAPSPRVCNYKVTNP